jgi:hypothetical protein
MVSDDHLPPIMAKAACSWVALPGLAGALEKYLSLNFICWDCF